MNIKKHLLAAAVAMLAVAPSFAQSVFTFQGVTFETQAVDSDSLKLTITNANHATGDWTGVNFLKAFSIKDVGSFTSATISSGPSYASVVESSKELTAKGCTGGSSGGACFTFSPLAALTSSMTWQIDFTAAANTTLNFSSPHLKVDFYKSLTDKKETGSLLSQNLVAVTAVPEPESAAMMLAGLALMGAIVRRRKGTQA